MTSKTTLFFMQLCSTAATALLLSLPAHAAEPALIQGNKIAITVLDMQADSLRMPPEMRGLVLSRPQTVTQIAGNLYSRRAMADKAQADGMATDPTVAAALQVARDKVLSDALIARIDKDSAPTDAAAEGLARNVYAAKPDRFKSAEQVQVRHILIPLGDDGARAKAEKTLAELKAGANFAALAAERSADKGSAAKGGELGAFARGQMVPEFDAVAFAMQQPGELSNVVETKFGFHILQLQMRRPAGMRPYEEVRAELVKEVRESVLQDARIAQAQNLQQDAKINMPAIEAFAATYKPAPIPLQPVR